MVHIITGPIDSGKTSRLVWQYRQIGTGDGFLLLKQVEQGHFIGQRIERITTGRGMDFSRRLSYVPAGWDEAVRHVGFSFSAMGLAYADTIIKQAHEKATEPLFIDEIGPLELEGKCFFRLFRFVIETKKETYITARSSCLHEIIKTFKLDSYEILPNLAPPTYIR